MNYQTIIWSVSDMKIITSIVLTFFAVSVAAAEEKLLTAKSAKHRVSLFELYTSEGCSSCPPADRYLSGLVKSGINNQQLIPLAFHVTYWDYIGWKDPFASASHDDRQRVIAKINHSRSIYTPQFVFNGSDYRQHKLLTANIQKVNQQAAVVDIILDIKKTDQRIKINMKTDSEKSDKNNIVYYLVLYENKLVSQIKAGENDGETLSHNYVVRKIHGPFKQKNTSTSESFKQDIKFDPEWKQYDLGVVAYAQDSATGEILQAVELKLF